MQTARVTFASPEHDPAAAMAALVAIGFEFGPSHSVTRTVLDTFDGRVHAAGLRLELCESGGLELILSGPDSVPAHVAVPSVSSFPTDLPAGPFRSRLASIVDVRALLAFVRVTAKRTAGTLRDRAGKTVAIATVHEQLRVHEHDGIELIPWTIEIDEIPGYGKRASKARDALERLGLTRLDGCTLDVAAAAAGVDLTGFSGSPNVSLDPAMPAIDGFRSVLINLADTIVANWGGTTDRLDPEFLHDLRVAVRRTRSVLTQGKEVLPPAIVERGREQFAWLGAQTAKARDLDVYLVEWDTYTRPLGAGTIVALGPVRTLLERRRASAHETLESALQSAEATGLMSTWRAWLREPMSDDPPGAHADRPLGQVITKRIARAQAELVERGRLIRPDSPPDQIHDLRKDAKSLRYLLECFGSLLPGGPPKAFMRRLKDLQDNLGEHQDADVHVVELRAISRELHAAGASLDTLLAIGQLSELLEQRRAAERAEFTARFAAYDTKATRRTLAAALDGVTW